MGPGAMCSLFPLITIGITSNRLTLVSNGEYLINTVSFNGKTSYSSDGLFYFDITPDENSRILKYSYYGDNCNSTGFTIAPPIISCAIIPDCSICIDNINYIRCNKDNRLIIDAIVFIAIISFIYITLWITVPLMTLLLALFKPVGSHGIIRRYLIYSAIISGSIVNAACLFTNSVSGNLPLTKQGAYYVTSLLDSHACITFAYTDLSLVQNEMKICYESFEFHSVMVPSYDFASSLSTTSATSIDWTNTANTVTTYSYFPSSSNIGGNMTQGDVGSLVINNNDVCCSAQKCRDGLMCMNEVSSLVVDGVATMLIPESSVGTTYFSITTKVAGNNTNICLSTSGSQHQKTYNINGLEILFTSPNIYNDVVKQQDLTQSTMIWDRFGYISSIDDIYYGSYPPSISTPYDDCSLNHHRQANRTVLINTCSDFDTYGIIDNRQIYAVNLNALNFEVNMATGLYSSSFGTAYTSYVVAGTENYWNHQPSKDIEASANVVIQTLFADFQGHDYLTFLKYKPWRNVCTMTTCIGTPLLLTLATPYNIAAYPGYMRLPYSGRLYASYNTECSTRTSPYVDQFDYKVCMLEVFVTAACYSPVIFNAIDIFSICLYTASSLDYESYVEQEIWYHTATLPRPYTTCGITASTTDPNFIVHDEYFQLMSQTSNNFRCALLYLVTPDSFMKFLTDGAGASFLFDALLTRFSTNLQLYDINYDSICTDTTQACVISNIASLFSTCMATCYNDAALNPDIRKPPVPGTAGTNGFNDATTAGCGLPPTNVVTVNPIKCSSYPEYRWPYSLQGTPTTNGMIPPTIAEGTCVPPMSDGCWASFNSGNGQSSGGMSTMIWQGKLPPSGNALDVIYPSLTITHGFSGTTTISDHEDYTSDIFINAPSLSISIKSKFPINEESQAYASGLNLLGGFYVAGEVNGAVTFIVNAGFQRPGVISMESTVTGSSTMQSQYCYIDYNFNCTVYATCTDTPCMILVSAQQTNSTINSLVTVTLNIPEACTNCNSGGDTQQYDSSSVGQGCFLFCWNFSGIGGFFGALLEWGIVFFIVILGLTILCMVPNILQGITPKKTL